MRYGSALGCLAKLHAFDRLPDRALSLEHVGLHSAACSHRLQHAAPPPSVSGAWASVQAGRHRLQRLQRPASMPEQALTAAWAAASSAPPASFLICTAATAAMALAAQRMNRAEEAEEIRCGMREPSHAVA